jgi:hypothetical protein
VVDGNNCLFFIGNGNLYNYRNIYKRRKMMSKIKDFIHDFLDVVNNDLPHFEKMVQVMKEGNKTRNDNK